MTEDDVAAVVQVARRIHEGEEWSGELMAQESVPVALRLLMAAVALSAAERPVNKKSITAAAPAARSASYRDHAELLEALVTWVPSMVAGQLQATGSKANATELARQLARANEVIAAERSAKAKAEKELAHVAAYARELHNLLKPEHEAMLRDKTKKVSQLRSVRRPGVDEVTASVGPETATD